MKKKGFTLVELLAVIVILSVIAIITVPLIGNVIEESKKKALEQSAYGLVEAADYYIINNDGEYSFLFDNNHKGETINGEKLDYKGTIEGNGKLYIDNNGDISLCINTDKYYVYKSYNSGIVVGNIDEKGECIVKKQGKHYIAYLENEEPERDYYTKEESDERFVLKTELASYATQQSVDTLSSNLDYLSSIVSSISESSNSTLRYNPDNDYIQAFYNDSWHNVSKAYLQQYNIYYQGVLAEDCQLFSNTVNGYTGSASNTGTYIKLQGYYAGSSIGALYTPIMNLKDKTKLTVTYYTSTNHNLGIYLNEAADPGSTDIKLLSEYSTSLKTVEIDLTPYTGDYSLLFRITGGSGNSYYAYLKEIIIQ